METPDSEENKEMAQVPDAERQLASTGEPSARPDDHQHLSGLKLVSAILALTASIFLIALDQGIVATAIPKITDEFNSINDVGWYGSGYLLMSTFQPLYGKLFTLLRVKHVFLMSLIVFELGSLICAVAPNSAALIIGRVIAGFGGSGVYSGVFILMAYIIPLVKRPMYAAADSIAFGIGSVAGPLLGGVFTDKLTWRWCFYINLPFGVVAVVLVWVMIKAAEPEGEEPAEDGTKRPISRALFDLDSLSIGFLIVALCCLLLVLQWGGLQYTWGDGRVIALLVVAGVLVATFAAIQHWVPAAYSSIPRKVYTQRTVISACLFYMGLGGSFMPLVYYLPIWFQTVKQASALKSGLMTLPMVIAQVIASAISGTAVTKFGYYTPWLILAAVLMAVGAGMISTLSVDASPAQWIGFQVIYAVGLGLGGDVPQVAMQTVLPMAHIAKATTLAILCETVSASVFISVSGNILLQRLVYRLQHIRPSLTPQVVNSVGLLNLQATFDDKDMPVVITAYSEALSDTFKVSIALSCLCVVASLLMEWKSVKGNDEDESELAGESTEGSDGEKQILPSN